MGEQNKFIKFIVTFTNLWDIKSRGYNGNDIGAEMTGNNHKMELFNSVYAKHCDTVFTYILISLNHNKDLANDCMQDTAELIMQKIDTVINHPNPGGFFIVTAKNYIHKYKAMQRKNYMKSVPFDETMSGAAYEVNFDRLIEGRINIKGFKQEILNKLDDNEFALYSMFYEKKMSVSKIAQNLRITEGNVKVRLFRLRVKVKKMVSDVLSK